MAEVEDHQEASHYKADFNKSRQLQFLPPCRYCASPASSPTGKAKGKAKCLWRREEMQKYTPSLLKGKRGEPGADAFAFASLCWRSNIFHYRLSYCWRCKTANAHLILHCIVGLSLSDWIREQVILLEMLQEYI